MHIGTQWLTQLRRKESPKSTVYVPVSVYRPADFIALRIVKSHGGGGGARM